MGTVFMFNKLLGGLLFNTLFPPDGVLLVLIITDFPTMVEGWLDKWLLPAAAVGETAFGKNGSSFGFALANPVLAMVSLELDPENGDGLNESGPDDDDCPNGPFIIFGFLVERPV